MEAMKHEFAVREASFAEERIEMNKSFASMRSEFSENLKLAESKVLLQEQEIRKEKEQQEHLQNSLEERIERVSY